MPIRILACVLLLVWGTACSRDREGSSPAPAPTGVELSGGNWFDGRGFVPGTRYVAGGRLTGTRPQQVEAVIDLAGGFVVPAFGEAHNPLATRTGVDMIAHLPGWRIGSDAGFEEDSAERFTLTHQDAAATAERRIAVATTVLAGETSLDPKHPSFDTVRGIHRDNLRTLAAAGVTLVIGSDFYGGTSIAEAVMLGREPLAQGIEPLGVFDNLILLRMLSEVTPRVLFPDRKIGRLDEGYEATFLVLEGDPLADFANVRRIRRRFKTGAEVEPAATVPQAP